MTTFDYENASDPDLLTKVTDAYGRYATIGYDAEGRLTSITDAAGMTSTFTYTTGDFITAMTTPYGTTSFRHEPGNTSATYRVIEAVDPVGRPRSTRVRAAGQHAARHDGVRRCAHGIFRIEPPV